MNKLDQLTKEVISLGLIPSITTKDGVRIYKLEQGTAMSFTLLDTEGAKVVNSFLSKGTIFPYHKHDISKEILIVTSGAIKLISDCGETLLQAEDIGFVEKCDGHMVHAKEDSWVIAISIPADKDM